MNFIPRFLPCNTECKQGTSALRSFVRSAPLRYLIFQNSELVELPARGTRRSFALALVGLTRLFGVEPALFAPADAAMAHNPSRIISAAAAAAPASLRSE